MSSAFNVCALANNFTDAGFTAIIDEVVPDREDFDWYVEKLRGRPVLFVVLAPPLEVCQQRNEVRPEADRVDYDLTDYYESMRAELSGIGWSLDSSQLTPGETAAAITARAGRGNRRSSIHSGQLSRPAQLVPLWRSTARCRDALPACWRGVDQECHCGSEWTYAQAPFCSLLQCGAACIRHKS